VYVGATAMRVPAWETPPRETSSQYEDSVDDSAIDPAIRHQNLSVALFAVGFIFFPVWWAAFVLLCQDRGQPWAATGVAKGINTTSATLGAVSSALAVGVAVAIAVGALSV